MGHMPSTEEEARDYQEMKSKITAKDEGGDQSSETWTEWAKDKISGGLGLKHDRQEDGVKKASDLTSDAAKKTKDKIQNVASGSISLQLIQFRFQLIEKRLLKIEI